MESIVTTIMFYIALVFIAMAFYAVWFWVLRPLGFASYLSPRNVEFLNRIAFYGYSALFAILMTGSAVASWLDGKTTRFLRFSLAACLSVISGVVFFLNAAELGGCAGVWHPDATRYRVLCFEAGQEVVMTLWSDPEIGCKFRL